jgi:6,7-dimethyl-8-ribityllumazine synthase
MKTTSPETTSAPQIQLRKDQKIAIVVSSYHSDITDNLCAGAKRTLHAAGIDDNQIMVVSAPGTWEIPLVTKWALLSRKVVGAIALGVVIRGETTHDQHINRFVSLALGRMALKSDQPIAFGVLTCNDKQQAIERSGGRVGNKGEEAAQAVLRMLQIKSQLDLR